MSADLTVLEAKRYGVLSCQKDQTLAQAAKKMVEEDISALVVIDADGFLEGIISRTDLIRAFVEEPDWQTKQVVDFMNQAVVTVSPEQKLSDVARILLERQIHRVVVAREEMMRPFPISVISAADIVYHMTQED